MAKGVGIWSLLAVGVSLMGCGHFSVTAVSEAELCGQHKAKGEGIPFYLPKPLLVISKNFYYIEEAKVGLTQPPPIPNSFDKQSDYASLSSSATLSTTSGGAGAAAKPPASDPMHADDPAPKPGSPGTDNCCSTQVLHSAGIPLAPDTTKPLTSTTPFFTYQIVFVPDLSQKHFLRIKGGPGEVRAALNLVNGWMFTGLGPFYMKDSSTAQNILATGIAASFTASGTADVINSVANLSKAFQQNPTPGTLHQTAQEVQRALAAANVQPAPRSGEIVRAEIHVFEPSVGPDGQSMWHEINVNATHFEEKVLQAEAPAAFPRQGLTADHAERILTAAITQDAMVRKAEAEAGAAARTAFQEKAMAAVATPVDPATEKAVVLQALAPPPQKKKCCLFDWLCGRRNHVTNNEVAGPVTGSQ